MNHPKPFQLNIPIAKIDEEQRMVWGYATLEEIDKHGEIIGYDASKKAFSEWPGNIREMHQPIAVGKGIEIKYDDDNKGVWLGTKLSESADGENAWTKVKEGILGGYSIGGSIKNYEMVKIGDEEHLMVTDYDLSEVSLVDNPACPGAVLQVVKSVAGKLERTEEMHNIDSNRPWFEKHFHYSSSQQVIEKSVSAYNKGMNKPAEIKKDVYGADVLIDLACDLKWVITMDQYEQKDTTELEAALKAIKQAAATELAEDEVFPNDVQEAIFLATQAVDLKKGAKVEKSVVGQPDRDEHGKEVVSAEENGRPTDDTAERAAEAPVADEAKVEDKVEDKPADEAKADEATPEAPVAPAADAPVEDTKPVENAVPVDFTKSLSALTDSITKSISDLGAKVEEQVAALAERVEKVEGSAAPTKVVKGAFMEVEKSEDVKPEGTLAEDQAKLAELTARAEVLAKSTANDSVTHAERMTLGRELLKYTRRVADPNWADRHII